MAPRKKSMARASTPATRRSVRIAGGQAIGVNDDSRRGSLASVVTAASSPTTSTTPVVPQAAARQTPGPSRQTPGPSSRQHKTPLPAVATNLSNAYGAVGQAASAQRLATQSNAFVSTFAQGRQQAQPSGPVPVSTQSRQTSRAPRAPSIMDPLPPTPDYHRASPSALVRDTIQIARQSPVVSIPSAQAQPVTADLHVAETTSNIGDVSKSFGDEREGGIGARTVITERISINMSSGHVNTKTRSRFETRSTTSSRNIQGTTHPLDSSSFIKTAKAKVHSTLSTIWRRTRVASRFVARLPLQFLLGLLFSTALLLFISKVDTSGISMDNFNPIPRIHGLTNVAWSHVPNVSVPHLSLPHISVPGISIPRFSMPLFAPSCVDVDQVSINELKKVLPEKMVVKIDEDNGEIRIPDNFWAALLDKIAIQQASVARRETWQSFLQRNEASVRALSAKEFDDNFNPHLRKALKTHDIVTKDMFAKLVQDNMAQYTKTSLDKLVKQNKDDTNKIKEDLMLEVRSQAEKVARQVSKAESHIPSWYTAAQANMIQNEKINLRSVNFFSPALGTKVDPYLSSPVQGKVTNNEKFAGKLIWLSSTYPAMAALEPWDEVGQCWCAAPSHHGKAQIAVLLPHKIFPTKITVDNIPQGGTLDPLSAPKGFELWAEVKHQHRSTKLEEAKKASAGIFGPAPETNLPKTYVLIHKWQYDPSGLNHVQTSEVDLQLQNLGIAVHKVVVRVTENLGQDWTCLYRLRLHGDTEVPLLSGEDLLP